MIYYQVVPLVKPAASSWLPTDPGTLIAMYAPVDEDATLVKATQPTVTDYDMETADVTNWPNYSDPTTRTKETTSPSPAGGQYLRIVHDSGGGSFGTSRSVLISGNRYQLDEAYLRGDASVQLYIGGGVSLYAAAVPGTGAWLSCPVTDGTATGTVLYINSNSAAATYFELDELVLSNLSRTRWNPASGTPYLSNATAAQQGWWDSSVSAVRFAGGDRYPISAAPSAANWTAFGTFSPDAATAQIAFGLNSTVNAGIGIDGSGRVYYYDGTTTSAVTNGPTITGGQTVRYIARNNGGVMTLRVNGTNYTGTASVSLNDYLVGARSDASTYLTGWIKRNGIYSSALSDTDLVSLDNYLAANP